MSDSVGKCTPSHDVIPPPNRVFSHALNTVKRLRTTSTKPPPASRLLLYGLYKQSMEGDVADLMPRPSSPSPSPTRSPSSPHPPSSSRNGGSNNGNGGSTEAEKWDAWKAQEGLSRTEAKKRYVERLIETMKEFAADTREGRELVGELEFVWEQVRNNLENGSGNGGGGGSGSEVEGESARGGGYEGEVEGRGGGGGMRVLSPVSQRDEGEVGLEVEVDMEAEEEEFVDAQDSQYNVEDEPGQRKASGESGQPLSKPRSRSPQTQQWKRKMEQALIKMTTEVAALREQLESRRWYGGRRRRSLLAWLWWFAVAAVKHLAVDVVLFALLILWLRRKKDRRLEGAVRVLLGDAVAQVQKIGEAQRAKIQLPKLPSRKL